MPCSMTAAATLVSIPSGMLIAEAAGTTACSANTPACLRHPVTHGEALGAFGPSAATVPAPSEPGTNGRSRPYGGRPSRW